MMPTMMRILSLFMLVLLLALPGSGDAKVSRKAALIFDDYDNALRWGEIQMALTFVDPITLKEHPLTELELKRFDAVQFTSVVKKDAVISADGSMDRVMEIGLVGKYTQRERTIIDHQHWRYDVKGKRYWLVSGLPDITATDD
jgi:hypothetical protein